MHDLSLARDLPQLGVLFLIGAVASGINAVAGGGSFISFPVLTAFGIPSVMANATNAAALWPGSLGSAYGYLNLLPKTGHHLKSLFWPTLLGTVIGAYLLLALGQRVFDIAVPFLIFGAAIVLTFQDRIKAAVNRHHGEVSVRMGMLVQFLIAVYGGYFGAGMGFLMLASYALYVEGNLHELNAMKVWLGLLINLAASVLFVVKGQVLLTSGTFLALGAIVGGYLAARYAQRLNASRMRGWVAAYGFATAAYFAWRVLG